MATNNLEPPSILIYGKSKIGKTVSFIQAFGPHAFWVCTEHGALTPALSLRLNPWLTREGKPIVPDHVVALSEEGAYDEMLSLVDKISPIVKSGRYKALIIDTMTEWADRVWLPIARGRKPNDYGRAYTENLYPKVKTFLRRVLGLGIWVGVTAHERSSAEIEGRFTVGGPMLPGRLVEHSPTYFNVVLHARAQDFDGKRQRVFLCDPLDKDWITGDRYDVCPPIEPADLPAIVKRIAARRRGEPVEVPVFKATEKQSEEI